jgi:uncharacterized protein
LPAEIGLPVLAWCAFALACGGVIKGALGVGTPLLTVPLMALVLPAQTAVVLMAIPVVLANLWQASHGDSVTPVALRFWPCFAAILAGMWIGVKILTGIDESTLLLVVGAVVIGSTAVQASAYRLYIPPRFEKPTGVLFGFAGGVVGGISSMFGPMLIIYLVALSGFTKNQFVSSISFLYVGATVPWVATLAWFGILDGPMFLASAVATVPVGLGMVLGQRLRRGISEQRFHKLVLVVLLASGGTMIWRAFS